MLKKLLDGWRAVAKKIAYVQSQVVLTVVYFVVLAPFAVVARLLADPLQLRGAAAWHRLPSGAEARTMDALRQQF
jgi:hypothetical protein